MKHLDSNSKEIKFVLNGELDIDTADNLRNEIATCYSEYESLVLDFSNVDFVDSTGLGVLVKIAKSVDNSSFSIVNAKPHILKLFRITGLIDYFIK